MSLEALNHSSARAGPAHEHFEAYEHSVASSVRSPQSSTFSDSSAHSSIATSVSDDFRSSQEDLRERDRICAESHLKYQSRTGQVKYGELNSALAAHLGKTHAPPTYADVTSLPSTQRQHPRRCSLSKDRRPPHLVRQRDRKIDFVDNLVDSATQMVEVIWPLSVVACQAEGGNGRGVLPLRTYIEETLRRSRTSYSTLQVALYYLILIMPSVPSADFTVEQSSACPADRALMCGRRMFLAALILASKYLQDRNYSAKAWKKMSGLSVTEINTNERTFLERVNWRLHVPKPTFEKWQELVLRYTPRPQTADACLSSRAMTWREVVPRLTPELDTIPLPLMDAPIAVPQTNVDFLGMPSPMSTPTPRQTSTDPFKFGSTSQEGTPTPSTVLPRFLEPRPDVLPPTPALVRLGCLPTPQMTPASRASNTPAASACNSRRPSMCSAMAQARSASFSRCALDVFSNSEFRHPLSRRSSLLSSASLGSSPESMITDRTRPSRSSSISSTFTASTSASTLPQRACLARQATCRNVKLPLPAMLREVQEEGTAAKPIVIDDDVEMTASPDLADFSVSEKVLRAPHRHSKHAPHIRPAATIERTRKRGRLHGGYGRSDMEHEISSQLQDYHAEEMEVDEHLVHPSVAANYASRYLLPTASHHDESGSASEDSSSQLGSSPPADRVAIRHPRGNKRSCIPVEPSSIMEHRSYHHGLV